jgi:drug/metabolite transporter (DMT)-like permease
VHAWVPATFVVLWSTGFVVARYGTDDAGPLTFLTVRLVIAALVLGWAAWRWGGPRPSWRALGWVGAAGLGLHALYLGGVFVAIDQGMPSGVSALIAGLHPVVTAVLAWLVLGEGLAGRRWLGVALGLVGVVLVVVERTTGSVAGLGWVALAASAISLVGMSVGTLVQRRHGVGVSLLWATTVQYALSATVLGAGALASEGWRYSVTARSSLAMAWAVGVLSVAAVLLMLWLLQRRTAASVSSLFFITPALSTVEGAVLFGERLGVLALMGLALGVSGVALVSR